jgi:hypothetical protein
MGWRRGVCGRQKYVPKGEAFRDKNKAPATLGRSLFGNGGFAAAQGRRDALTRGRFHGHSIIGVGEGRILKGQRALVRGRANEGAPCFQQRPTGRPLAGVKSFSAQAAARRRAAAVRRTAASRCSTSSGLSKNPSAPRRMHSRRISPEGSELATKTFDAGRWLLT